MRTKSSRCTGLAVAAALIGAVLVVLGGVRAECVFGQSGGAAVADACEPTVVPAVDFNLDERVDVRDFAQLAQHWRGSDLVTDVGPSPGDGIVDFKDLSALVKCWLRTIPRPVYITWLGHASVRIAYADMVIYVDPLDLTTSPHDATLILVTHSHSDHYSPTDIDKVSGPTVQFIAPVGVATGYARRQSIAPGQVIDLPGVRITGVAAYNITKAQHPRSSNWVGFIVELGSKRIYCAGDTDLTPEMKALTDIDLAFLPAGGTFTMTAAEAADATKYFMPTLAIPYHWGRPGGVGTLADAQLFARNAACNATVMTKGKDGTINTNELLKDFSLAAHWQLDEVAGSIVHDSNGSNHGTLNGGPVWRPADGKVGGALELDGIDDYVSTPFVLNPSAGAFSVFVWAKGGGAGQVILSQQTGVNWLLADASDGALATDLKGSGRGAKPLKSSTVITDGEWHRLGVAFDGTSRMLYVDDVQVAKDAQTAPAGSTGGLYIGAGSTLAPGTFWSGLIDDVRIYARAVKP
jgi:L-ascorbate metabolism protein UlaG (beta-lactamase superfamily)